jgi:hypothetical protein
MQESEVPEKSQSRKGFIKKHRPHFDHPYVAPEGQAFNLLMETAAKDYENLRNY